MSIGIIIQARVGSKRLPKKVYRKILGRHLLEWVIIRSKKSKLAEKIIVAIPDTKEDSILLPIIKKNKADFFQGNLNNVLDRYFQAAKKFNIDPIIRITGDCPLIDPFLIDQAIKEYLKIKEKPDYFLIEGYPFGLGDIEIIRFKAIEKSLKMAKEARHFEHVVSFISDRPDLFKIKVKKAPSNLFRQDIRLCVDELPDFKLVKKVAEHFGKRIDFTTPEILKYLDESPNIAAINKNIRHNYIIPKDARAKKESEKKVLQQIKKIVNQKNPESKGDWDLIMVLSGGEESIENISKGKRNEDKDRLETAIKIAKEVLAKRLKKDVLSESPTIYYNGSNEQNDNLKKIIKKGFLQSHNFPKEKMIISENLYINNTEDQFSKMPPLFLKGKRKIVIVTSAYHIPRVEKYVKRHEKKFDRKKIVLYASMPKFFEPEKSKEEAEKIFKYF
jgi:spore coat polysaccharide biosynthesis protein SpsF